jgi:Fic family protein
MAAKKPHHDPLMIASTLDHAFDESAPLFAHARQLSTKQLAARASEATATRRREQIVELLADRGPLTAFQIADILGIRINTISGRFTELVDRGQIEIAPERGRNDAGRQVYIYRLPRRQP